MNSTKSGKACRACSRTDCLNVACRRTVKNRREMIRKNLGLDDRLILKDRGFLPGTLSEKIARLGLDDDDLDALSEMPVPVKPKYRSLDDDWDGA